MIRRFSYSLILIFACTIPTLYAQEVKVQISDPTSIPKDKLLQGHIFSDATGHYVYYYKQPFMGKAKTLYLEKYDNKLKRVVDEEYKTAGRKVNMHGLKYFKNKFIWLMSEKDSKKDKMRYKISKIGLDGSLTKARTISSFDYNKFRDEPDVEWAISEDTTKAFFVSLPDSDKKSNEYKAHLTVIDNSVSKLWSKTVKLPYSERQVDVQSWALSNKGEVYFLAKVYEDNRIGKQSKRGKKGKEPSYDYYIFIQRNREGKLIKKKLDLDNSYVGGAGIRVDAKGNLACTGLYKERYRGPIQGVFYLKFDGETGEPVYSDMRDFTSKELSSFGRYNTSKDRKTKDVGLDNSFRFNDIQFLDDGGLIAIAEEFYVRTYQSSNGRGMTTTRYVYYCNSIIDIRVSAEGEVTKVGVIPKRMASSTTMFAYHSVLNDGKNIYYFYNDNRKNLKNNITNPDQMRSPSSMKSYVAVVSYIDKRGKFQRKEAFRSKEVGSLLMPEYSHQIDKNRLFFFNSRPRMLANTKFQFGIITVE